MMQVDKRRADIDRLVMQAQREAYCRNKKINTIDPLVKCARHLFPYLPEAMICDYSRTALRIIRNERPVQTTLSEHQTTLISNAFL